MGRSVLSWVCVFALVAAPVAGCSDESGGAGGNGGVRGGTGGAGAAEAILAGVECVRGGSEPELDRWDFVIESYESADATNPPDPGKVVFTGDSLIWRWPTLADDMLPVPALNRGFGGSVVAQAVPYVNRIVLPYEPSTVVLSSGGNDLSNELSADCVFRDYEAFVDKIEMAAPDLPIYFIDLTKVMLDEQGEPIEALFIDDQLHLNEAGYELWTSIVRPVLMRDLGY